MSDLIMINGHPLPCPAPGMSITRSQVVDSGRNTNGAVVGQLVGRKLWKIDNLKWNGLSADEWAYIQGLLEPFFVDVTFTTDSNERINVQMYPSDTNGEPLMLNGISYKNYKTCSFNLVDCGW